MKYFENKKNLILHGAMVGCYQASVSGSGSGFEVFNQIVGSSPVSVASHCRYKLSLKCEKVKLFF
jgi:hypothetical protein